MINTGKIQGSKQQAQPLIIGKDTVYVHTNIKKIEILQDDTKVDNLYEYDEVQYDKDEYIQLKAIKDKENDAFIDVMTESLLNTQERLLKLELGM